MRGRSGDRSAALPRRTSRRSVLGLVAGGVAWTGSAVAQMRPSEAPAGGRRTMQGPPPMEGATAEGPPIIDTHAHLLGRTEIASDFLNSANFAIGQMDLLGIRRTLLLPPPQPPGFARSYDHELLLPAVRAHADRLSFLAGGGSLSPMIVAAGDAPAISAALRQEFEATADRLIAVGAVGFGEITVEHVSYEPNHPYVRARPDGPLMLLLADLAARHNVPIDLHMDAVVRDRPPPENLTIRGPNNPPILRANIDAFERLLAHNRGARIVWAHAGRDILGDWTVDLSRRLLAAHDNLIMSIALFPRPPLGATPQNFPFSVEGTLKPEWISLLADFSDRFVIGNDPFYAAPNMAGLRPPLSAMSRRFVNALPQPIATAVAYKNAVRLYRLAAV